MDANMAAFLFMQEAEEIEADIIDDKLYNTQLSAALLIAGAQEPKSSAVSVATKHIVIFVFPNSSQIPG
jgi:hypothetical protein